MPDYGLPTLEEISGTGQWELMFQPVFNDPFGEATQGEAQESLGFAPPMGSPLPEVIITPPPVQPVVQTSAAATLARTLARLFGGLGSVLIPIPAGPRELDEPQGFRTPPPPDLVVPLAPFDPIDIPNPDPEFELDEVVIQPPGGTRPPGSEVTPDPIMPPNWDDLIRGPYDPFAEPITPRQPFGPLDIPGTGPTDDQPGTDRVLPATPIAPGPNVDPDLEPATDPTAPAPGVRPSPSPTSQPVPIGDPTLDPLPIGEPVPQPGPAATPGPGAAPAPLNTPLGDPLGLPFGDPFALPPLPTTVTPRPPSVVPIGPIGDLLVDPIIPTLQPTRQPPRTEADRCNCEEKKDKKPKKKKPPREECWQGTYTQKSRGIVYARKRRVPCEQSTSTPKSSSPTGSVPIIV